MPELLPCPFCGAPGSLFASSNHSHAWEGGCTVEDCAAFGLIWEDTEAEAIAGWNTRAAIQQAAGAVPEGLIACLRGGAQCDEDGTNIIMNREACCVAADILERLAASPSPLGREAGSSDHLAACAGGGKLWLWKNFVDGRPEYWAFDNPYPIHLDHGDPQTLGEPCGYALFKPSRTGRTDVSEAQVLQAIVRTNKTKG